MRPALRCLQQPRFHPKLPLELVNLLLQKIVVEPWCFDALINISVFLQTWVSRTTNFNGHEFTLLHALRERLLFEPHG